MEALTPIEAMNKVRDGDTEEPAKRCDQCGRLFAEHATGPENGSVACLETYEEIRAELIEERAEVDALRAKVAELEAEAESSCEAYARILSENGALRHRAQAAEAKLRALEGAARVCRLLDGFQKEYEHNTRGNKMPGNDLYCDKLMAIVEEARAALARPTPSQASASNPDIKKEDPQILLACADQAAITWAMGGQFDNRYHAEIVRRLQAPTSPAAPSTLETRARQLVEVYDKEDVYWAQLHIPEVERLRDALDRLPAPGEKGKEEG